MYTIADEEIDFILDDIRARGVTIEDLQFNILDHVCCIIESEKPDNQDFYEFYRNTIARFFRSDLKEIEEETNNLLTFKNYYAMKRTLKIVGVTSAVFMTLGAIFKVAHWPGAGILLVTFMALFSLLFLPLLIILKLRDDVPAMEKVLFGFGTVLGIGATMGTWFKLMHWPFANVLMIGSTVVFLVGFIPSYFLIKIRNQENRFNTILNATLMLAAGGMLFSLMNLGNSKSIDDSILAVHYFLDGNTKSLMDSNTKLYQDLGTESSDVYAEKLRIQSDKLNGKIDDLKALLVSKSEKIPVSEAKGRNINQVMDLKNSRVVREYANNMYDIKPGEINTLIKEYNEALNASVNYPINTEHLQLHHTNLGLMYHQLTQIQMQLAMNQNSYLQYKKGSMAAL